MLYKCYLRPTAIFLDVHKNAAPCYQHMKTQPPHQHVLDECKKWVTSMPNSNVRFYKEDIIAGGVHISLGLISGEYVLLQKHVETVKIRRAFNLKVVIVRKSKNSCTDIELFLHNYIMPFCHYTTPRIFFFFFYILKKSHSMKKHELRYKMILFQRYVYSSMWM